MTAREAGVASLPLTIPDTVSNSSDDPLSSLFRLFPHHIPNNEIPYPEPMHRNNVCLSLLLRHRLLWCIDRMVRRVERRFDPFHSFPLWNRVVRHWCSVIDGFPEQSHCLGLGGREGRILNPPEERRKRGFDLPCPFVSQSRSEVDSHRLGPAVQTVDPRRWYP